MEKIHIDYKINNLEIICKLLNSVAKRCGCRVKYSPEEEEIRFYGDPDCKKFIVEEMLSFFPAV